MPFARAIGRAIRAINGTNRSPLGPRAWVEEECRRIGAENESGRVIPQQKEDVDRAARASRQPTAPPAVGKMAQAGEKTLIRP